MRKLVPLTLSLAVLSLHAENPAREVLYVGSPFGPASVVPTFDKGHLLFLHAHQNARLSAWGPGGRLLYDTTLKSPEGGMASVTSAAIDTDGIVVVGLGHAKREGGYGGSLVFLDRAGSPARTVPTGRFVPSHLCFGQDQALWVLGWQRDPMTGDGEDQQDHPTLRRYSRDGQESGAFLPSSLFPGWAMPGGSHRGLWTVRAARDRMGALLFAGHAGYEPTWVEWDYQGRLLGRWKVGHDVRTHGLAYTQDGQLYRWDVEQRDRERRLLRFDRVTGAWQTVASDFNNERQWQGSANLLGADGNELVFYLPPRGGAYLRWLPVSMEATDGAGPANTRQTNPTPVTADPATAPRSPQPGPARERD